MKADFLRERAQDFLKTAKFHISEEVYHLAALDLEQALELYLKYYIFLKIHSFPKTHSLEELFRSIGKVYGRQGEVNDFLEENAEVVANIKEAYINSRYMPTEFTKSQVEDMKGFVKKAIEFLRKGNEEE